MLYDDHVLPAVLPALEALNLLGIFVFAASGAVLAAAKRQTMVTFVFFALVTGVGGGTVRDLLIGADVFWLHENRTLLICLIAATIIWLTPERIWRGRALDWLDAVGMASYATYGAAKALGAGVAPVPAFALGVITASVGGIIRDILAGEPSILMRPELYITPAALSSGLMVALMQADVPRWLAAICSALLGFSLRAGAIVFHWKLPAYRRN